MKVICVDDEPLAVEYTLKQCRQLPEIELAEGFQEAQSALDYLSSHSVDLALLDINMQDMDGITLAARIKQMSAQTAIVFLTAYKEYAFDAYSVHPAGYLLKPVSLEKLASEVRYLYTGKRPSSHEHIRVKTFGNFELCLDEQIIHFKLAKAKEILAYLVDRQGFGVTRAEIFAAIWEDSLYNRRKQKQLDVYIRSLRETLREYGIEEIMEMKRGILRVRPELFTCDAYLFFSGDIDAINSFRGEYMSSYSWASLTESNLFWKASAVKGSLIQP